MFKKGDIVRYTWLEFTYENCVIIERDWLSGYSECDVYKLQKIINGVTSYYYAEEKDLILIENGIQEG